MIYRKLISVLLTLILPCVALAADPAPVRVGTLKYGTVNWELDVTKTHGFDQANGIDMQVVKLANKNATSVALLGGEVDAIVTDWIWVSRQRAEGADFTFFPYSNEVGGLVAAKHSNATDVKDLLGKRIGIAGGPVDKSWLFYRAYAQEHLGVDLAQDVEPVFGAPPLLNELLTNGEIDAAITFWHYRAKLIGAGNPPLITTGEVIQELGLAADLPLLGWAFSQKWAAENPELVQGLLSASYQSKALLLNSDEEWKRLEPKLKAATPEIRDALIEGFRHGIPRKFTQDDRDNAANAYALLAKIGGKKLVGNTQTLSEGTFYSGFNIPSLD